MKKEALNHGVWEDLSNRNDNWDKLDGVPEKVDALEEEVREKVQNFKIKNEVVNGDFSNGLTNWQNHDGASLESGKVRLDSTGEFSPILQQPSVNANLINLTDVYYASLTSESEYVGRLNLPSYYHTVIEPAINDKKGVNGATFKYTRLSGYTIVLATVSNSNILLDNVGVINLTQTFGAGNEPTKEAMDELMKVIPNGWWDGELTLEQKEVVQLLLKKANRQQEEWITPTLLNGWKSLSGREVQYMKDEMGFVHFRGDLDPSTKTDSTVFIVPMGYRPSRNEYINIGDTVSFIGCSVSGGYVTASVSGAGWQTLNYFKYRAN